MLMAVTLLGWKWEICARSIRILGKIISRGMRQTIQRVCASLVRSEYSSTESSVWAFRSLGWRGTDIALLIESKDVWSNNLCSKNYTVKSLICLFHFTVYDVHGLNICVEQHETKQQDSCSEEVLSLNWKRLVLSSQRFRQDQQF